MCQLDIELGMEGSIRIDERLRTREYIVNKNRTVKTNYVDELINPVVTHGPIIQSHLNRISGTWLKRASTTADRNGKDRFIAIRRIVVIRVSEDVKDGIHTSRYGALGQLE